MICLFSSFVSFAGESIPSFHDLALNLAASFIVIGLTVLIFNRLENAVRSAAWEEVRSFALESLWRLSNMAVSHSLSPFGISIVHDRTGGMDGLLIQVSKRNLMSELGGFTATQWTDFIAAMILIREEVADHLANYSASLKPSELAAVLNLKAKIRVVILFTDAITEPVTDPKFKWPKDYGADFRKETSLTPIADGLLDYFDAARRLRGLKTSPPSG